MAGCAAHLPPHVPVRKPASAGFTSTIQGTRIMADVAFQRGAVSGAARTAKRSSLRRALKRKSSAAFLMTLPLILLIGVLVIYPALYSLHLATLNKSMAKFVGFGNFEF